MKSCCLASFPCSLTMICLYLNDFSVKFLHNAVYSLCINFLLLSSYSNCSLFIRKSLEVVKCIIKVWGYAEIFADYFNREKQKFSSLEGGMVFRIIT